MARINSTKKERFKRLIVLVMAIAAIICYAVAYFQPMWGFYLDSPQYPDGLILSIYLDHVGGDVDEINVLNHYIGMARLDEAAQFERAVAGYGVIGVALVALLLVVLPGRRVAWWLTLPALAFPIVFVSGTLYWMYSFGHNLDPAAPITIKPFMPTLVGPGAIGNFKTVGLPGLGFYLVLAATAFVAVAFLLRRNVCGNCGHAVTCDLHCPHSSLKAEKALGSLATPQGGGHSSGCCGGGDRASQQKSSGKDVEQQRPR